MADAIVDCKAEYSSGDDRVCGEGQTVVNEFVDKLRDVIGGGCVSGNDVDARVLEIMNQFEWERICADQRFCRKFLNFNRHRYTRHMVATNENFSVLIICWYPGQATPIHEHGWNTGAYYRVLRGGIEVHSQMAVDRLHRPVFFNHIVSTAKDGSVVMKDSNQYHKTVAVPSAETTISLHVFSPPYFECRHSSDPTDICFEKMDAHVPYVHCVSDQHYLWEEKLCDVVAKVESTRVYSNFSNLFDLLRKTITVNADGSHDPDNVVKVQSLLERLYFNPKEIERYSSFRDNAYTRNLIGYDDKFTLLLLCWEKGQMSPIHDHAGSNCWVKVMRGTLQEVVYRREEGQSVPYRTTNFTEGGVTYMHDRLGVHKMGNPNSEEIACSLHIYSPPYHECLIFDEVTGEEKKVSISVAYGARFPFMERKLDLEGCPGRPICTLNALSAEIKKVLATTNPGENCANVLKTVFQRLKFCDGMWKKFIHFDPMRYTRNLLVFDKEYSLVLICWLPSQSTPIHVHEVSSSHVMTYVYILEGGLTFQFYDSENPENLDSNCLTSSLPEESRSLSRTVMNAGDAVAMASESMGYHKASNLSTESPCISLHLYSPPYIDCQYANNGEIKEVPVAYCSEHIEPTRGEAAQGVPTFVTGSPPMGAPNLNLEVAARCRPKVFANFYSFSQLVQKAFSSGKAKCDRNTLLFFDRFQFNPLEWRKFACVCNGRYTRNLVACGEDYSLYLNFFQPGQSSPIHDHAGSPSCVKILEGELLEEEYKPGEKHFTVVPYVRKEGDSYLLDGNIVHRVVNKSDSPVFSLHLYSPPFSECSCYNDATNVTSKSLLVCDHHMRTPDPCRRSSHQL